jgi:hypothetical protein
MSLFPHLWTVHDWAAVKFRALIPDASGEGIVIEHLLSTEMSVE